MLDAFEVYFRYETQVQQSFRIEQTYALQYRVIGGTLELEPPLQFAMDIPEHPTTEVVVDVVADGVQLFLGGLVIDRNYLISNEAIPCHNHHQDAAIWQSNKLHLIKRLIFGGNGRCNTEGARNFRQQLGRLLDARLDGAFF